MPESANHDQPDWEPEPHVVATRYFLGRLSEEERDDVRARLLADDAEFEAFRVVEAELADQYVRGELSPEDEADFEQSYPDRRKARLAHALAARRRVPRVRMWRRFVMPLALAATVLIAAYLIRGRPPEIAGNRMSQQPAVTFAFALVPGQTRSAGRVPEIDIPPDVAQVEIRLGLDAPVDHVSYTVVLNNQQGNPVFSARNLPARKPPSAPSIDVHVAAPVLASGTYEITLYGLRTDGADELIDYYSFRVR